MTSGSPQAGSPQAGSSQARARASKARSGRRPAPPGIPAPDLPVARVVVDLPLPHLDRTFDYLVTDKQHEQAVAGCRVRVRFAGQLVDGFLLERVASSEHKGRLAALSRVVSNEPVLSPEIATLCRSVADRYAGTLTDVLRLAIPRRHATVEAESPPEPDVPARDLKPPRPNASGASHWKNYVGGPQFLERLTNGDAPRAVWCALPGGDWPLTIAEAISATSIGGRGSLVVVPDQRDLDRLDTAVSEVLGEGSHVTLTADLGPRERYRRWLAIRRGQVDVVLGTRAAAFAPVANLGLVALWDDGDDLHAEPRAPYPHVREVLALRSHQCDSGLLVAGFARTAEGASLIASGFARSLVAPRATVRTCAPRVRATDDATASTDPQARLARLPHIAWRIAREALTTGPVLVQVPRGGYLPSVTCARCHSRAHCPTCNGPLGLANADNPPVCRWCAKVAAGWQCQECGGQRFRAAVVGASRTAEELGRAFPGVPVVTSSAGGVLASVAARPTLVVATPGAEPIADGGYAAALLLDTWALLGRADLRASEEALRRWLAVGALVRPASQDGQLVIVGDAALRPIQALVRWDPVGFAARELDDRVAVGLPPALRVAEVTGTPSAVADLLDRTQLPAAATVTGPVAVDDEKVRALIRAPRSAGLAMSSALREAAGERSARKAADPVTIRVDPTPLL